MITYLTTEQAARMHGVSAATLRRRAAAGEIPGALRISGTTGAWRFPVPNDSTPATAQSAGGGVSADRRAGLGTIMSGHSAPPTDLVSDAMRVSETLHTVVTRPARAAGAMLSPLVAIASRHYPNRDGWCAACGWQHPCRDYSDATTGLAAARGIVLDGAA